MREKILAAIEKIIMPELLAKGYQVEDIRPLSIDDGEGAVVLRYSYTSLPGG